MRTIIKLSQQYKADTRCHKNLSGIEKVIIFTVCELRGWR